MYYELNSTYCSLHREKNDPRLYHESTVVFHLKRLLNGDGYHFTRMNPSKHGLTSCNVGLWDRKAGIVLWHERYAVENAATEFNSEKIVMLMRVNAS